jgi:hypothetical protein
MIDELRSKLQEAVLGASDEDVIDVVMSLLAEYLGADPDNEFERFDELPEGLQIIWATRLIEAEVLNGGFNQLYWNSTGAYAPVAVEAYQVLGLHEAAQLVQRSLEILETEREQLQRFWKENTLEAFSESYKHTTLGTLDERFWPWEEEAERSRVALVRQHPEKVFFS